MSYLEAPSSPESVWKRTRAGQCELIARRVSLTESERRLLSVMTGFTPLADLAGLLGEAEVPQEAVAHLLEHGLVKLVSDQALDGVDADHIWTVEAGWQTIPPLS